MSYLESINPPALGTPRGYSNGILAPAGGRLLLVAGQIAWDRHQVLVGKTFADQFSQALSNVLEVVHEAGGSRDHLAQLTIYVTDRAEYLAEAEELGRRYRSLMGLHFPAMALVEVSALLEPGAKVEIQAQAILPPPRRETSDVP